MSPLPKIDWGWACGRVDGSRGLEETYPFFKKTDFSFKKTFSYIGLNTI